MLALLLLLQIDPYGWPLRETRSRDYDVLHYRIEMNLEEAAKAFTAKTTIDLAAASDGLDRIELDAETFVVERVQDDDGRSLAFDHDRGRLNVRLAEPLSRGERATLAVTYSARNVDVDPERFGMSAGYDLGLDFKEPTSDNPRLINTLSFPEGARHWFPANDHPGDRATGDILATVRTEYKVLSNGRLVGVTDGPEPEKHTWHWSLERPHPTYLFVLVAGPYVVLEDSFEGLPVNYWVYEKDRDDAMRSFRKTPAILRFFSQEYRFEYPWVKYDQITIPGIGGGAESTTATVLGQSTIHDERAEQDFPSHGLVAHEAAHQWWGDLVSYRDWPETWISEGFATYGEYLFSRHDLGGDEGAVNLLAKKEEYLREARDRYQRPIVFSRYRHPNDLFDRHSYQKAAVVIHMLRFVMGDDPFQRALARFLTGHAFSAVDTRDLMTAIKEASGQDLDWFFEQWIYRPGHPVFDVSYRWSASSGKLLMSVEQIQDTSGDVPVFRSPIEIGVRTADSKTSHRFWLEEKEEILEIDGVTSRPLLVRFDEGNYLLKEWTFEKSVEELVYQLGSDDVIGRMWAAGELKKHGGDPRARAALREAAADPFWAVRESAVSSLAEVALEENRALFEAGALDEKSQVRSAAIRALGRIEGRDVVAYLKARFREDDSYLVQAETLRAIGEAGDAADRSFLEEATRMPSPRRVIERAARRALERLR